MIKAGNAPLTLISKEGRRAGYHLLLWGLSGRRPTVSGTASRELALEAEP